MHQQVRAARQLHQPRINLLAMLDIRANDEHFAVPLNPETIRSAGMVVPLRGDNGFHIVDAGEVFAGISDLQELEIGPHVIQLHREIFRLHLDFENLPQIGDCLVPAERQERDLLFGIIRRGKERKALDVVPVKVRERDTDLLLLVANGAKVSAQISQSRAGVNDGDLVRIGDLQARRVAAELLKTGIADGDGSPRTIKLELHIIVLCNQASGWRSSNGMIDCLQRRCSAQLQVEWCCQLELHFGSRANDQRAGSMPIPRLSTGPRRASRLDAVCFYGDIAAVHRKRRKFKSEWLRFARVSARRLNLSERLGSRFQYNRSFDGDVLVDLCREVPAYWVL